MKDYKSQYMHPKWQKRRLEMLESAGFLCQSCESAERTLHVHHKRYIKGRDVWDYADDQLDVLCSNCHESTHFEKDALADLLVKLGPSQTANMIGIVAGMLKYSEAIEDHQLNNWRMLSGSAVDVGLVAAYLLYDRSHKEAGLIASVLRDTPVDSDLVINIEYPLLAIK